MAPTTSPCLRRNAIRAVRSTGSRAARARMSDSEGGATRPSIDAKTTRGTANTAPAAAGIQRSGTPACRS